MPINTNAGLLSAHIMDVMTAFEALSTAMTTLTAHIITQDAALPAWFILPPEMGFFPHLSVREQICVFLQQFEYLEAQPPKEILIGPGVVAASQATLEAIVAVNAGKQHFKTAMLALKSACGSLRRAEGLQAAFDVLLNKRPSGVARNLQRMGLSRLHLKQCYRLIPYFAEKPAKISWTWANTRSIKRITVAEADALLLGQGEDSRIAWQRQKLAQLPMDEPLAIVQELAPHLRANIVFRSDEQATPVRKMIKGPVPFFYAESNLCNPGVLPQFVPPKQKKAKDKDRLTRSDRKLEDHLFLPAIRAHRYVRVC